VRRGELDVKGKRSGIKQAENKGGGVSTVQGERSRDARNRKGKQWPQGRQKTERNTQEKEGKSRNLGGEVRGLGEHREKLRGRMG